MSYIISVLQDGVIITAGLGNAYRETPIKSVEDLDAYLDAEAKRLGVRVVDLAIYNSSTMDFPHDSTDNLDVLSLVALINDHWSPQE